MEPLEKQKQDEEESDKDDDDLCECLLMKIY